MSNELDYHFIISVELVDYPSIIIPEYNEDKKDIFCIYDWCAHLWYEGEPVI